MTPELSSGQLEALKIRALGNLPMKTNVLARKIGMSPARLADILLQDDRFLPPKLRDGIWEVSQTGHDYLKMQGFPSKTENAAPTKEPEKQPVVVTYDAVLVDIALERFRRPDLLHQVYRELDKDHVGDDCSKVLLFLIMSTALMQPKNRISFRLSGNSAGGKDNLFNAVAKHLPEGVFTKYTGTSDKFLLRLIDSTSGIYVGELNMQRRGGSNQNIIEILKARMEGGTNYGFLETETGNKQVAKTNKVEQGTVGYSTTEIENDDELATRAINIAVTASEDQTKAVLNHIADTDDASAENAEASWISAGLSQLDRDAVIAIPKEIKQALASRADTKNLRARRDIKRLFSIIRASAFIHQLQRPRQDKIVYAVNADVYHALRSLDNTLNRTYTNIEPRMQVVLDSLGDDPVPMQDVVERLDIRGKNRKADIFRSLENENLIRRFRDTEDKRKFKVQLIRRGIKTFLKGSTEEIFGSLPHFVKPNIPICKNGATDVEKIGLISVELGIDRFIPIGEDKYPVVDFIENQDARTYFNLSKPIIKPISGALCAETLDRYNRFSKGIEENDGEDVL
jgi:hypothetical protein